MKLTNRNYKYKKSMNLAFNNGVKNKTRKQIKAISRKV